MKYELDVLAALAQLSQPTTQEIVAATGISERKVQNVIKALQNDLNVEINKVKKGRNICYLVAGWGVFESGLFLKRALSNRSLINNKKLTDKDTKAAFYDSVKMDNYRESARLEGISVNSAVIPNGSISTSAAKRILIEKYAQYKNVTHDHG